MGADKEEGFHCNGKVMKDPEARLAKLFGSISRGKILKFLYSREGESFYQREILYETGLSLQPLQRELGNLVALGILKKYMNRNRVYYQINTLSQLFNPLREICEKIEIDIPI